MSDVIVDHWDSVFMKDLVFDAFMRIQVPGEEAYFVVGEGRRMGHDWAPRMFSLDYEEAVADWQLEMAA